MPQEELTSVNLPIDTNHVICAGTCNDVTFYLLTQRPRPDSELENNWTVLEISEHSLASGGPLKPGPIGAFPLEGKIGPTDIFANSIPLGPSKILFTVTVTEGKHDQELFALHGYLIECSSLKSTARKVFALPYDGANVIPSATFLDRNVWVVMGKQLIRIDTLNFDVQEEFDWPDDSVKYPFFAAWDGKLFALLQVNLVEQAVDKILCYDLKTKEGSWIEILPNHPQGHLKLQWHKSQGTSVQIGSIIFVHANGRTWALDLSKNPPKWSLNREDSGPTTEYFLFADSEGTKFLISQCQNQKQLFKLP